MTPKQAPPSAPTRKQLLHLYADYPPRVITRGYQEVKKQHPNPLGINSVTLTSPQFQKFIETFGIPKGYKKEDFNFLTTDKIY